jgi:glycosyltransferase involved in cell wall biosynthesis
MISHLYPAPGDDRHLFVHEQARALQELGVHVRVISPTPYTPRLLWRVPRLRRRGMRPRRAVRDGITADYPRVLQPPRRILFHRLGDFSHARLRRLPWLQEAAFDLVHAHQALPDGGAAQRLAGDLGLPYVVTVNGVDVNVHLRRPGAVAERTAAVLRGAAAVVAVSSSVAGQLRPIVAGERLHVNLNGVVDGGQSVAPADLAPGRRLLLSAGNLIASKGNATVIDALSRLASAYPDLDYAIAGEGVQLPTLTSQAARLGLAERVHFLGLLAHDRLLALMARADVFVQPSSPEGFGQVYAEAMSQGTPVIACRDEGPADYVQDGVNGWLVAPGDADALAAVIATALDDPAATHAVAEAGRQAAAALTWTANAQRQLAIYEQVLAAQGSGS